MNVIGLKGEVRPRLVGLYARCSTKKQDLIAQRDTIKKYFDYYQDNNNVEYVEEFFDDGYSGASQKRPKLQEMLQKAKKGEINTIIVVKLDRLARTLTDLLLLSDTFKKNDIDLIVIKDNIDTSTPAGTLYFQMLGAFIEFERSVIIQRMSDGRDYALKHGSKSGLPCHRPRKKLDLVLMKKLYHQGLSISMIAKQFSVSRQTIKARLMEEL